MWVRSLQVRNLRSIAQAGLELEPGLNVFFGKNAQGKTSVLEAVGLVARGRSFRTERLAQLVRHGADGMSASVTTAGREPGSELEVRVDQAGRELRLFGRTVAPREYHGRLEAVVYSTERLAVVHGSPRQRRQYFDRGAAALWPAYRQLLSEYERVLQQRNAALASQQAGLEAWDQRFLDTAARLRVRRAAYLQRLQAALDQSFRPAGERYTVSVSPAPQDVETAHAALVEQGRALQGAERRRGRTLFGPHRDPLELSVDGLPAEVWASAGQARSLLLALSEAALAVYEQERGTAAVALLDDLDSELDEGRADEICRRLSAHGQLLVTTAHASWARSQSSGGRVFEVEAGRIRPL